MLLATLLEHAREVVADRGDAHVRGTVGLLVEHQGPAQQLHGITRVAWEEGLGYQLSGHVIEPSQDNVKVYALRQRAGLFGNNAPDWLAMPDSVKKGYSPPDGAGSDWPNLSLKKVGAGGSGNSDYDIFLDAFYPHIVVGSWVLLARPDPAYPNRGYWELY